MKEKKTTETKNKGDRMNAKDTITLARKHVSNDSSRLCLADAVALYDKGDYDNAKRRAVASLEHSVGVFHKDHKRAVWHFGQK